MFKTRLVTWLLALGTVVAISSVTELPTHSAGMKSAMGFVPASALTPAPEIPPASFAVVELFTSEGCSSCPPADKLLAQIASEARASGRKVIPLAFHVDYWNRLGWKDPYSSALFSRRQGEYSRALQLRNVYTPQMVVNGTTEFAGGNAARARKNIEQALMQPPSAVVKLDVANNPAEKTAVIKYQVAGAIDDSPVLNVAVVERGLVTDVARGENAGQMLRHENVVRSFTTVGLDQGVTGSVRLSLSDLKETANTSVVGYLQDPKTMKILGAEMVDIGSR